jgi:hypothetical protein
MRLKFKTRSRQPRVLKIALLSTLVAVLAFGALATNAVLRQKRDFNGTLQIQICRKAANGAWEVIDEAKINSNFTTNLIQAGRNEKLNTDFNWRARSAKGHELSFRLVGNADPRFNTTTGFFELRNTNYELTVLGVRQNIVFDLTTETVNAPNGTFSGKRAQVNGNTGTLALIGVSKFKPSPVLLEKLAENKPLAEQLGIGKKPLEDFIVVSRIEGTITATK